MVYCSQMEGERDTMRSEREMLDLILTVARGDERVRAVWLNGSRTNPNAAEDPWRDYDVVFAVTETTSFRNDPDWACRFGTPAIVQEPDYMDAVRGDAIDLDQRYAWLMLFRDGNRIDLTVLRLDAALEQYGTDSLTRPLLDKDGILPPIPASSDRSYWIQAPTAEEYDACVNEFWWCLNNTAKGLRRHQLPYAMWMTYSVIHPQLVRMCEWYIGAQHGFALSTGSHGKYFEKYMAPEEYRDFCDTYASGSEADLWRAVFVMCRLFGTLARKTAGMLRLVYRQDWETGALGCLWEMERGR